MWRVGGVLGAWNVQVDDDGLLAAADDHCLYRLILASVQFLMRDVWRDVDEVSGAGFVDELEMVSPAKACAASHYIDHGFKFPVVMRAGPGIGMHNNRSRPEFLRADSGMRDGLGAVHAGRLRSVDVEFAAADDAQAVVLPVGGFVSRQDYDVET